MVRDVLTYLPLISIVATLLLSASHVDFVFAKPYAQDSKHWDRASSSTNDHGQKRELKFLQLASILAEPELNTNFYSKFR